MISLFKKAISFDSFRVYNDENNVPLYNASEEIWALGSVSLDNY